MNDNTFKLVNIAVSSALILFFSIDVVVDLLEGDAKTIHFYIETFFVAIMTILFVFQIREFNSMQKNIILAEGELSLLKKSTVELINSQIDLLKLTNAEREISWLLIKGVSYKKIAELRSVSERTVNQQVGSIFKKSKVKNRHEFISGFIEDLMN